MLENILLHIFNGIVSFGIIPGGLKSAVAKPISKGGAHDNLESQRPIFVFPSWALVLEKHILKTMTTFLGKFDLLSPTQHGFTAGRGTDLLLEQLVDTLHSTFKNNKFACALFLHVSKAFVTISHKLLLKKTYI